MKKLAFKRHLGPEMAQKHPKNTKKASRRSKKHLVQEAERNLNNVVG
jgi:hypothetical protein